MLDKSVEVTRLLTGGLTSRGKDCSCEEHSRSGSCDYKVIVFDKDTPRSRALVGSSIQLSALYDKAIPSEVDGTSGDKATWKELNHKLEPSFSNKVIAIFTSRLMADFSMSLSRSTFVSLGDFLSVQCHDKPSCPLCIGILSVCFGTDI